MPHRIPATLNQLRALEGMGITAPPRPYLGLSSSLLEGKPCTPEERALDAEYQRQLDIWISQVDSMYAQHIPHKT